MTEVEDLKREVENLKRLLRRKDAALQAIAWKCAVEDGVTKEPYR
jgi:hypothetical protein